MKRTREGSSRPGTDELRRDLAALSDRHVVVYGSYVTGPFTERSDIDVAVVTGAMDRAENRRTWRRVVGTAPDRYDVRVLELLPLDVQHDIALAHEVVYGDPVEVSYELYRIHRRWKDEGPRIRANAFTSVRERLRLLGEG